jgi:hypothetical protein
MSLTGEAQLGSPLWWAFRGLGQIFIAFCNGVEPSPVRTAYDNCFGSVPFYFAAMGSVLRPYL